MTAGTRDYAQPLLDVLDPKVSPIRSRFVLKFLASLMNAFTNSPTPLPPLLVPFVERFRSYLRAYPSPTLFSFRAC